MSRRLLGAALLVVAAVAAVVGTFLPLFSQGGDSPGSLPLITSTSWEYVFSDVPDGLDFGDLRSPQFGVPIVVAALLLGVAAALVALPESQRLASRYLAIGGTGLLAGGVWGAAATVASTVGNAARNGSGGFGARVGEGIVLLGASVVVAVVGVVLLHGRRSRPRPEGPVVYRVDADGTDDDTATPPFGFPVPEVEVARLPESEHDRRPPDA
ncbi:hypothetical protein AB0425_41250 [Actinosynnema sp. NPDC051121]